MMKKNAIAIGDLQGCRAPLHRLLTKLPQTDNLVFVGDLVNRGPDSLGVLRDVMAMGNRARVVLGNHDLHLLAVAAGVRPPTRKDTIQDVLEAPDAADIIEWLRHQPLLIEDEDAYYVHAGIHPLWTGEKAVGLAREVEGCLQADNWKAQLKEMYGGLNWDEGLTGPERIQAVLNVLTRMRYVNTETGLLDFHPKGSPASTPSPFIPWFDDPRRVPLTKPVVFGHWSTLGVLNRPDVLSLDTGALWGGQLTGARAQDRALWQVDCEQIADPLAF